MLHVFFIDLIKLMAKRTLFRERVKEVGKKNIILLEF